jgi:hypothetical protein
VDVRRQVVLYVVRQKSDDIVTAFSHVLRATCRSHVRT